MWRTLTGAIVDLKRSRREPLVRTLAGRLGVQGHYFVKKVVTKVNSTERVIWGFPVEAIKCLFGIDRE